MATLNPSILHTIDAPTLYQRLQENSVVLVDVREPGEFRGEHIAGATCVPLSQFNLSQLPPRGDRLVLYCQSGTRTKEAARRLFEAGWSNVTHLGGGILAWKELNYPIVVDRKAPISIMRQVQLIAGSLVLIGTILGALVSPWFLVLSGFVGAGLTVAGATGTCMMARLLARLPYNQ
jgi:rhodanese-related sulfurtransferase